jgi:hypothetical protein
LRFDRSHGCRLAGDAGRGNLGQAEIQNLGVLALGHKNVGGLDVAVNNTLRMRGVQPIGNLNGKGEQSFCIERFPRNQMFQRRPVQKLHGDERLLAVLADLVDGADIGMIESRRGTRLATKPLQGLGVAQQFIRQEFQRHGAAQIGVLSLVDNAHAAAAKRIDDAVVRDGLADHLKTCPRAVDSSYGCNPGQSTKCEEADFTTNSPKQVSPRLYLLVPNSRSLRFPVDILPISTSVYM